MNLDRYTTESNLPAIAVQKVHASVSSVADALDHSGMDLAFAVWLKLHLAHLEQNSAQAGCCTGILKEKSTHASGGCTQSLAEWILRQEGKQSASPHVYAMSATQHTVKYLKAWD